MDAYKDLVQLITPIVSAIALYYFQKMSESVAELNKNVAVIISRIQTHEDDINEAKVIALRHASEISELKMKMASNGCFAIKEEKCKH